MSNKNLGEFSLSTIYERCRQENERYRHAQESDARYCFELFQRAIILQVDTAWGYAMQAYEDQVIRWVERNSAYGSSGEEPQYFVNRTFEKFWQAMTPEKFQNNFINLGAVLSYLKMCVTSVILDHIRANTHANRSSSESAFVQPSRQQQRPMESKILQKVSMETMWEQFCELLNNELEELVAHQAFVLDLSAKEILLQNPDTFSNIGQIYRIKENILKRLRRNPESLLFLKQYGGN